MTDVPSTMVLEAMFSFLEVVVICCVVAFSSVFENMVFEVNICDELVLVNRLDVVAVDVLRWFVADVDLETDVRDRVDGVVAKSEDSGMLILDVYDSVVISNSPPTFGVDCEDCEGTSVIGGWD